MLTTGSDAIAVVDGDNRVQAVVTVDSVLAWVAAGAGDADQPIAGLLRGAPPAVGSAASVIDGVLAIAEADADALAVTSDGSSSGQLHALVTSRDIARVFGDQPISILREIRLAANTRELRELNHRARALALQYLTSAASLDWLARFVSLTDVNIVKRIIALAGGGAVVRVLVLLWRVGTGRIAHQTCAAAGPHRRRRERASGTAADGTSVCPTRSPNATTLPEST